MRPLLAKGPVFRIESVVVREQKMESINAVSSASR